MFAYGGVYTAFLLPCFVVRCERLFRRVALGFLCVLFASYASFVLFPVTAKGFRPEVTSLDTTRFVEWGAALNYTCDPPMNCFPSLHVATIVLASLCAWKADRLVGVGAFALAFVISLSTLFVKQHYVADVVAGAAVAGVSYLACVRGYDPVALGKSELEVRYTRWGVAGYVGCYLFAIFGVLGPMFLVGFKPWESKPGRASSIADVSSEGK
jgi:membrane-associated phospholipid phosphatase